jgi:hypothetical protein
MLMVCALPEKQKSIANIPTPIPSFVIASLLRLVLAMRSFLHARFFAASFDASAGHSQACRRPSYPRNVPEARS